MAFCWQCGTPLSHENADQTQSGPHMHSEVFPPTDAAGRGGSPDLAPGTYPGIGLVQPSKAENPPGPPPKSFTKAGLSPHFFVSPFGNQVGAQSPPGAVDRTSTHPEAPAGIPAEVRAAAVGLPRQPRATVSDTSR